MTAVGPHGGIPPPGRAVRTRDGLHLNVVDRGAGAAVVLLHGLPGTAYSWGTFPQVLASRGRRVLAFDRVGYGHSSRAPASADRFTVAANALDVGDLLDGLGIERAALLGWSYGGLVAQAFALAHPERVSHLVLTGTPTPERVIARGAASARRVALRILVLRGVARITPLARAAMRRGLRRSLGREMDIEGLLALELALWRRPGFLETWGQEAARRHQLDLDLGAVRVPTLAIHGAADPMVPLSEAEALRARIPGATLIAVPDGGNALPWSHPEALADALDAFVR